MGTAIRSKSPRVESSTSGLRGYVATWGSAAVGAALIRDAPEFDRYLGGLDPLLAVGLVGTAGFGALRWLRSVGWVGLDAADRGAMLRRTFGAALGFGAAIVVADSLLGFPEGINVTRPAAILFYPVIGFVAEVVFHIVPLAATVALSRRIGRASSVWFPIAVVAAVEAAFQVAAGGDGEHEPWLSIYLAAHMFGFGATQVTLLRKYGFGSAMLMRLVYYAIWHLLWGHARLALLF